MYINCANCDVYSMQMITANNDNIFYFWLKLVMIKVQIVQLLMFQTCVFH